jgi:hypothetical protein
MALYAIFFQILINIIFIDFRNISFQNNVFSFTIFEFLKYTWITVFINAINKHISL